MTHTPDEIAAMEKQTQAYLGFAKHGAAYVTVDFLREITTMLRKKVAKCPHQES